MLDPSVYVVAMLGLALVVVPLVTVAVAVALLRHRTADATPDVERARRHGLMVNTTAWLVVAFGGPILIGAGGMLALRATTGAGSYAGLLAGLWPTGHALLFLGVHALGEKAWPRPAGSVRRAALAPRSPFEPRWVLGVTLGWAALLVAALVVGGATADDGRRLTRSAGGMVTSGSPYPGWTYGIPVLTGLVLVAVATWGVLMLVARRPAVTSDATDDADLRRLSAHRVLRGVQLVLAATLAAVLGAASQALLAVGLTGIGVVVAALAALAGLGGITVALVVARAPAPNATPGAFLVPTTGAPATGPADALGAPGAG
jgi:hypothetical protein